MTVASYRAKVEAGGCRELSCTEPGRPEFAVWWKCTAGHREELRYCRVHGPEFLMTASRPGIRAKCRNCGDPAMWMTPMIEGLPFG